MGACSSEPLPADLSLPVRDDQQQKPVRRISDRPPPPLPVAEAEEEPGRVNEWASQVAPAAPLSDISPPLPLLGLAAAEACPQEAKEVRTPLPPPPPTPLPFPATIPLPVARDSSLSLRLLHSADELEVALGPDFLSPPLTIKENVAEQQCFQEEKKEGNDREAGEEEQGDEDEAEEEQGEGEVDGAARVENFEECLLTASSFYPAVCVVGALGLGEETGNIFYPTGELHMGRPSFKHIESEMRILYGAAQWEITDQNEVCLAYASGYDQTSPFTVKEWRISDQDGNWINSALACVTSFPSVLLAGCTSFNADSVNGVYFQTSEIIGGRPVFYNAHGVCICYCVSSGDWQIQPREEKGLITSYAYATGPDQMSLFGNLRWQIFDGANFLDSNMTATCVFPSICISGATSHLAFLNGVYHQTAEMCSGRVTFRKDDCWICFVAESHRWMIQMTNEKGTQACHAHAESPADQTSPLSVSAWRIFDGVGFIDSNLAITCAFPSLSFTGARQNRQLNTLFYQTGEVVCGRPALRSANGKLWVCYSPSHNWQVQAEDAKGSEISYAFSCGPDQTSPFTVAGWTTNDEKEEADGFQGDMVGTMSFPSLLIYGATGVYAPSVNGLYHHTAAIVCGRPAYKKTEGELWICYDGRNWDVQPEEDKGSPGGYAHSIGSDQTSPFTVSSWLLYDGENFSESSIKGVSAFPSILFSGVTGIHAPQINGTFHQTSRIVGGKPAYRNTDGSLWCCFVLNGARWSIQVKGCEGKIGGFAFSTGDDQTSPFTVSGWKVAEDQRFLDSAVVCASTFPSLAISGATGEWANYVNGTFHATGEIVCGRPTFRNASMWVCYKEDLCHWQVQAEESKGSNVCDAYSVGSDDTSPFTASEWKTWGENFHPPLNCVSVCPSIFISGAEGPNAPLINGMFHQTSEAVCGHPSFRKTGGAVWLCYFAKGSYWQVQPQEDKGTKNAYAYSLGPDQTSPLTVTEWKVYNVAGAVFEDSMVRALYAFPSLSLSGATGSAASFINGTFHQTTEIVGGRPSFCSLEDTLTISFDPDAYNWRLVKRSSGKCFAFSLGSDQTSPHVVSSWKILKQSPI